MRIFIFCDNSQYIIILFIISFLYVQKGKHNIITFNSDKVILKTNTDKINAHGRDYIILDSDIISSL